MSESNTPNQKMEIHEINPEKGIINIGSHPENDIVVQDAKVMPFHMMVDLRQQPYLIVSLNPDADIQIDGVPLMENETSEVMDLSQVSFCGYSMNMTLKSGGNGGGKISIISPEFGDESISTPADFKPSSVPTFPTGLLRNETIPDISQIDYVPSSDVILVEIHEQKQIINVEQTAIFPLTIINGGAIVASFDVQVEGVPQEWIKITPERVNLNESGRGRVEIHITPPRNPDSRAGDYSLLIKVASSNYPGQLGGARVDLTVNPYYEFAVGNLNPRYKSVSWRKNSAIAHYPIVNQGNSTTNYLVMAQDDENGCKFEFQNQDEVFLAKQAELPVRPGEELNVPVRIMPVRRSLVRLRSRQYQYNVTTQSMNEASASRTVSGTFVSRPLFGLFSILMAIILLLLSAFFILRPRIMDFNVVEDVIALGDPAVLNWKVSPFTTNLRIEGVNEEISGSQNQVEVVPTKTAATYTLVAGNWLSRMLRMEDIRSKPITVLAIPPSPEISTFFVDKNRIFEGDDITIKWSVSDAEQAFLTVDGVRSSLSPEEFNNERTVTLRNDSIIVLEAKNDSGSQFQSEFIHAQQPTIVIEEFSLSETTITKGDPVTIIWKVSGVGVENVKIAPFEEVYPLEGELTFFPEASMEFVLTVKNRDLEQIRLLPIGVMEPGAEPQPPTVEFFKVAPEEIVGSGPVEFSWSVSGVHDRIEVSSINGVVLDGLPAQGFRSFNVSNTTSYVLTAYNKDLSSAAILEVKVNPTKKNALVQINKIVPDTVINRGDSVMVYYSVFAANAEGEIVDPAAMGWPELSGSVVVTDGFDTCAPVDLPVHACELTLNTSEKGKQIYATYSGDENYVRKTSEPYPVGLDVVGESAIFEPSPAMNVDPSSIVVGESATISFVVSPENPAATLPITGKVRVVDNKDDSTLCIATLSAVAEKPTSAQGKCVLTFTKVESISFILIYEGNDIYDGETTQGLTLIVNQSESLTTLISNWSTPTVIGQPMPVEITVSPKAPGKGIPTGTFVISDKNYLSDSCSGPLNAVGKGQCNLVFTNTGTREVVGEYLGDDSFIASFSNPITPYLHPVNKANTSTQITSFLPTTTTVGQEVIINYQVRVTTPGSGIPTGTVVIDAGNNNTCTGSINSSGIGQCAVLFTKTGVQSITASYQGDEKFNGSTGVGYSYTVNIAPTKTTMNTPDPTPSALGGEVVISFSVVLDPVSPSATLKPTGQAIVEASTGENCFTTLTADGSGTCNLTFLSEGSRTIKVRYLGTADFATSESAGFTHIVRKSSITTITSITGDLVVGKEVEVSVSVVSDPLGGNVPTGSVFVSYNSVDGCNIAALDTDGKGSCKIIFPSSGDKTLVATYSGNTEYVGSTSLEKVITISKASTTTEITSNHSVAVKVGEAIIVSVKVTSSIPAQATGKVNVGIIGSLDDREKCEVSLSAGTGSCSLTMISAGSARQIQAVYLGNEDRFSGSTSAIVTQQVDKAPTTTTINSISPETIKVKQEVTFTVKVEANTLNSLRPTGNFRVLLADDSLLCQGTLDPITSEGSCKHTFTTQGTRNVKAVYLGAADFVESTSSPSEIIVGKADTSISINVAPSPSLLNQQINVQVTVHPSSVGDVLPTGKVDIVVSKSGSSDKKCNNVDLVLGQTSCLLTLDAVGDWTVTVSYKGDTNYLESESSITHTVNKLTSSTSVSATPTPSVLGQQVTINVAVTQTSAGTGTLGGTVNVTATLESNTITCAASINSSGTGSCNLTFNILGTWSISGVYSGNNDFNGSTSLNVNHTVNKVPTITTITLVNPTPSVTGQTVVVTVQVTRNVGVTGSSPTGVVEVYAVYSGGDVVNCTQDITLNDSGIGSCNITFPKTGSWTLTAVYKENATYITSTSTGKAHTVNQADTETAITVPSSTIVVGQTFDVSVDVTVKIPGSGTPTGSVTVTASKTNEPNRTCTITSLSNGTGSCSLSLPVSGEWSIASSYLGDVNFKSSTKSTSKIISSAATTTTITETSLFSSQSLLVKFKVEVVTPGGGTPQGNVIVKGTTGQGANLKNESCIASVAIGQCELSLTATGTWEITAVFDEDNSDPNYTGSSSSKVTYNHQ